MNKHLIQQLRNGEAAAKNDGTVEELNLVLKEAFTNFGKAYGRYNFYFKGSDIYWDCDRVTELPVYSIKDFLTPEPNQKPNHYQDGIDTFERMEANATLEERLGFAKGNIDKYVWRKKGQDLEDFKKIIHYAQWAVKQIENER